jgi:hypothetical protein
MKWIYFIILSIVLPMSRGQVSFLDDPLIRPFFRRARNFMFNFNNYMSDDKVIKINEKMGVSEKILKKIKYAKNTIFHLVETSKTI